MAWARVIRASGQADQLRPPAPRRRRSAARVGSARPTSSLAEDHQPAGDEPRVLARLDHPGQVVQRGVDVGAADRLDEGAGHVVVLVAVAVVAHRGPVDRPLQRRPASIAVRRPRPARAPAPASSAVSARRASPPASRTRCVVGLRRSSCDRAAEAALVGHRAAQQRARCRRRSAAPASAAASGTAAARPPRRTGSRWWRATSVTQPVLDARRAARPAGSWRSGAPRR